MNPPVGRRKDQIRDRWKNNGYNDNQRARYDVTNEVHGYELRLMIRQGNVVT